MKYDKVEVLSSRTEARHYYSPEAGEGFAISVQDGRAWLSLGEGHKQIPVSMAGLYELAAMLEQALDGWEPPAAEPRRGGGGR